MNETLLELAKASGWSVRNNNEVYSPFREDYDVNDLLSEFAQAIVVECARIAMEHRGTNWSDSLKISNKIIEHFEMS